MQKRSARLAAASDQIALQAGIIAVTAVSLRMLARHAQDTHLWFAWADQGRYMLSAQAWAHGRLDPALHHYPPGYSLMAAPFIPFFPANPFWVPDLLCLGASLAIFTALATRLTPPRPGWRAACVLVFCITTLSSQALRDVWIIPWNTTGDAPFALGAILCTLRLCETPGWRRAAGLGVVLGIMAGIRPTDAVLLAVCCGGYAVAQLRRGGARQVLLLAGTCAAGIVLGVMPFAVAHALVHGLSGGDYVAKSAGIGFEWRLLPLRWVTLVLDARPLLPEGRGLAETLPWIGPGLAGLIYLTLGSARRGGAWWLVGGAIALHWCLYLCYRDLQPYGLWRFHNVHYFKWTFPFLLLAALRLAAALALGPRRRSAVLATLAAVVLMAWQPVGVPVRRLPTSQNADGAVELPGGPPGMREAIFEPLQGSWRDLYFGAATISAGDAVFRNTWDFKLQPVPGGVLLQPLRPLPASAKLFHPAKDTAMSAGHDQAVIGVELRFGLPCGIGPRRAVCNVSKY